MTEHIIRVGTAEMAVDLTDNGLVIGAFLVIHVQDVDRPGETDVLMSAPAGQSFVESLGLTQYAARRVAMDVGKGIE